jgi:DNA-binding response OmpR family regulator
MQVAGDNEKLTGNLHRLQPLRVLLASRDRRFMRVTAFLLSRRGYAVTRVGVNDVVAMALRERSDVVLLEVGESRTTVARTVTALQVSSAPPALVLLAEDGVLEGWSGLSILDKWTPIELLAKEIETAALRRVPPAVAPERESESTSL